MRKWVLGMGLLYGLVAWGQFGQPTDAGQIPQAMSHGRAPDEEPSITREMQAKQMKRLRAEHQKQVMQDTDRLVQLATALKADVEKGDQAQNDALKSVDEIGRLAKRVSERIKSQ